MEVLSMDVKDIVIDPGQVAVLIWMYRRDAYNVAGVFETVQLAYDHAMKFIYPEDQAMFFSVFTKDSKPSSAIHADKMSAKSRFMGLISSIISLYFIFLGAKLL